MARGRRMAKTYDFNQFLNVDVPEKKNDSEKITAPPAQPVVKGKKRRIRIGSVLILVFLLYTVVILGSQQIRLYRFEKDIASVSRSIEQAELVREQLLRQIELMKSDDYVEKIAREKLGLIKPGEIPYIAVPSENEGEVKIIDKNENIIEVED